MKSEVHNAYCIVTNLCIVSHFFHVVFLACIHVVKPGSNCVSAIATVNVNDFLILYSGLLRPFLSPVVSGENK